MSASLVAFTSPNPNCPLLNKMSMIKSDKTNNPIQLNRDIPRTISNDFSICFFIFTLLLFKEGVERLVNKIVVIEIINIPNGNCTILSA